MDAAMRAGARKLFFTRKIPSDWAVEERSNRKEVSESGVEGFVNFAGKMCRGYAGTQQSHSR